MNGSIDVTSPSPPINKSSMTWNHVLLASGTEQVQLSLDSISQVLLQTSEDGVTPPDVIVTVEKSNSTVDITDHFGGATDESANHENCERESDAGTVQQTVTITKKGHIRPTRKYHNWSENEMEEAVNDVIAGKYSGYAAAMMHNVPKSSLQNRVKKAKKSGQRTERTIEEPKSGTGTGRIDESLGRIAEDEIAMYCSNIESLEPARASIDVPCSVTDNVDITDGLKYRKYHWKENETLDDLKSVEGRSLPATLTRSQYGITSLALRDPLHRKAKVDHADGTPDRGRRRPRSKGTRWNEEDIEKAIAAIHKQGLSIRKAALCFGIPKSSLCDRLNGKQKIRQRFASTEEKVLAENMASESENLIRRRNSKMVKSKTTNRSKSREKLITANKCNTHLKSKLGDEVQVHIIDEEVVIDGRYDQNFEIRENERCGGKQAFNNEQSEEEQDGTFNHEEATSYLGGEMPELNGSSEKFEIVSSNTTRSGHLAGRITMTNEDIDRKEGLSTSAKSWTQREMDDAIRDVRDNGFSIRKAAGKHHIPKSSLADRISKQKCMKVIGRLVAELRPLAKTQEDVQRLKKLENGRLTPKAVAKRFGMSFACFKKVLSDEDESGTGLGDLQSELEIGLFQDGEEGSGDATQQHASEDQHNFCTRVVEEDSQLGSDSRARRARLCWKRDNLDQAIAAVREGRMSLRGSSKMYGIPKSTLGDILRGKSSVGSTSRGSQLLSDDEEASIAGWLVTMARAGRRVRVKEVLETVKAILDRKGTTVPRLKDNMPKDSWWYGFLGRHKEVAEIRRQSKADVADFAGDVEDIDIPEKEDEAVEYAPDKVTVLPAEQQYLVNSDSTYLHPNFVIESIEDDEGCLCSICGTARATENAGEQWISCGAVSSNGTQIEGCGGWSHLICTSLGQRNLSAKELRDTSWRCPKCVE